MEQQTALSEWTVLAWLHDAWTPKYLGWSLNENTDKTRHALIYRLPPFYWVNDKKKEPSPIEVYCNAIRMPVERPGHQSVTVTFNFNKIEVTSWDVQDMSLEEELNHLYNSTLKEDIDKLPSYFYYVDRMICKNMDPQTAKDICGDVVDLWWWDGMDISSSDHKDKLNVESLKKLLT